ncbi:hypothetical protein Tco_0842226 [Tanacetum coccineum]|uniref:Uncharacterized protein n=1 Tax=Tanacetum coccineum TaxID=301880 RepID=A0ABQ5B4B4_9ASTR
MKRLFKIGRSTQVVSSKDEGLGDQEDASKQGRKIDDITKMQKLFWLMKLRGEQSEKVVEEVVSTAEVSAAATITIKEITLAQALAELRSAKPKIVQAPTPIVCSQRPTQVKDKAEEEEQVRLAREKAEKVEEANISWDNIQAMIEAARTLGKEKETLCSIKSSRKEEKPPTKAQKKSTMSTYLKNMAGYKQSQLKNKSFAEIQKLFDKAMTRVNMFVDKDTELVKESSKKAETEMAQESSSKRAGEVAINSIPLATKPPSNVDWKIVKEGRISLFQIIRANGSSKRYSLMIQMLRDFDREDLETLWKLVKAKHGSTRPEEGYERVLWGDLRTMFEHYIEDTVWRNLLGNKVLIWKLIDSCSVHFVRFQDMHLFMLVEKRYPLTLAKIIEMLNKKLQIDHLNEMSYQLLKLMTK